MQDQAEQAALLSISPLAGRYRADVAALEGILSEAGLYHYRVRVEVDYLLFLARSPRIPFVAPLSPQQQGALRGLYHHFSAQQAAAIAAWDRRVNHDVKAVEYWLREQLEQMGLEAWLEAVHFGLTSEDCNNLAYGMMVRDTRNAVLLPALNEVLARLRQMAEAEAATPMLARTHGQPATPTTMGKELAVFAARLSRAMGDMAAVVLTGKLTGASGTLAAHTAAMPEMDWLTFSRAFVRSLGLEPLLLTTQIEPHDSLAAWCDSIKRINTILLDLCQDMWRYISDSYLVQAASSNEVGSSTMPHKVNPIDFENGEGNLGLSNALLEFFARKLPVSRLQRDLSDSTVLRNLGTAIGYSLIAYRRIVRGLDNVGVNRARMRDDLHAHPEVLAEAVQTILRRAGYPQPYEALKRLTRGRAQTTMDDLHAFIDALELDDAVKAELRALTPETYIGLAEQLAHLR